jgi:hypothetical protein
MKAFLSILSLFCLSQEPSQYSYLVPGNFWQYESPDGPFEEQIGHEKFMHNKIEYFQSIRKFADGTADISYYRIDTKTKTVYYLDNKSFKETVEIPGAPRVSQAWASSDNKWKYEVIYINAELKTPNHHFKDCIAIKAESNSDERTYINYYAKGIGFVASRESGKLTVHLTKWKLKEYKRS